MLDVISLTAKDIRTMLMTNDRAVCRALVALKDRQTIDERRDEATKYHNMRGFRPCHAKKGTSMAYAYERFGYLTKNQIAYWRRVTPSGKSRIEIYADQLLIVARENAGITTEHTGKRRSFNKKS